jgi:uncharacterized BrkB/YihY/UPF0761 family membrane protein
MWIKLIVLLALLAVLFSLFKALSHLVKGGKDNSEKVLKSLIWRLVFSIAIIVLLYVASFFGLIAPHGLPKPAATAPSISTPQPAP